MPAQKEEAKSEDTLQATSDINLATFVNVVKEVETSGHYYKGSQLWVQFAITEEEMKSHKEEYINSVFSRYDATKRNLLRLLKR
jgi:hypothetical protein